MALLKLLNKLVASRQLRHTPFPDHIWSRHSALLMAARNVSKQHRKV
jgi:hypothetical protein